MTEGQPEGAEVYTPGYTANASQFMAQRQAKTHAVFFLPYLQSGFNVLDCGCGPGTITVGLAQQVSPGSVTGIDLAATQTDLAREHATRQGIDNVSFQPASVYELPFETASFDAVFSHALIEHLATPLKAFQEMRRVLKPGGVAGICSPDWGGFLIAPSTPDLEAGITFYKQLQIANGGNPYAGRELGKLAADAGFSRSKMTAYYECYEDLARIAEYLALRIENASSEELARVTQTDTPSVPVMVSALRELARRSDGLFAQSWVAVIGYAD